MQIQELQEFFRSSFPNTLQTRTIGVENEYPAVFKDGRGISFEVMTAMYAKLAERGWHLEQDGTTGKTINAELPVELPDGSKSAHMITTDAGVHTIEIGLAPMQTMQAAEAELKNLVSLLLELLAEHDATLLGYGVQPLTQPDTSLLAPRGRYAFLQEDFDKGIAFTNSLELHASPDGQYDGHVPFDYGIFTLSAAGQTHIDITADEAIPLMNAFNRTSGLRIALLANSSVWQGKVSRYKALRELFWEWGWTNRVEQTGFAANFDNLDHYLDFILDFRGFMVQRNGVYYRMDTSLPYSQFMMSDVPQRVEAVDGTYIDTLPELSDIHFQCGTAWWTTRLQSRHGTIEDRCPCNQPPETHLTPAALLTGLTTNQAKFLALAERLPRDIWRDLRLAACKFGLQAQVPDVNVTELVHDMVEIAYEGLEMRGHGEETYLVPLMARITQGQVPADEAIAAFEANNIEGLVERFDMQRFLNE